MSVYYRNKQWVVDDFGLSTTDGEYPIEASRLLERRRGRYDWPEQVCGKSWVDPHAFVTAYAAALEHFHPDYDRLELARCVTLAFARLTRSARYAIISDRLFPPDPKKMFRASGIEMMEAVATALAEEDAMLAKNDDAESGVDRRDAA